MANIYPIILPHKMLANGRHKLKIALAHNGTTRYITTDIILDSPNQLKNGQIIKHQNAAAFNNRLRKQMQKIQDSIYDIDYIEGLSCSELISLIKSKPDNKYRTLGSIFDEYMSLADISSGSRNTYRCQYMSLLRVLDPETIIDNFSPSKILEIDKCLRKMRLTQTTIHHYMAFLRILIRYAMKSGYVNYKIDPFATYSFPKTSIRDVWLSVEDIRAIRDCKTNRACIILCRDMFMLSYYLGGMNLIDILNANFKDIDKLKYKRQKTASRTGSVVEFEIPEEAKVIISKYIGSNGRIKTSIGGSRLSNNFNRNHMPELARAAGIEKRLIYYSARKSFAQHAFKLGVSTNVIDYILGHSLTSAKSVIYHYIAVTPDMATKAIRLVLDNLK